MITDGVPTVGSVILLAMSLGFIGCSDDDDNKPKEDNEPTVDKPAEDVAGSYTGTISMVFAVSLMVAMVLNMNMAEMFSNESFTIVKNPGKENIPLYAEEAIPHKSVRSEPLFPHKSVVNRQLFPHKSVKVFVFLHFLVTLTSDG